MVVIAKKVGRLANRLLLFSHFIGTAVEHDFSIANPAFGTYAHYFPSTARDPFCRFPPVRTKLPTGRIGREILYRATLLAAGTLHLMQRRGREVGLIRLHRDQSLDLDSAAFLSAVRKHRALLVQDWWFRSSGNCEKHAHVIRSYFAPWEHHRRRAYALIEPLRRRNRFLVGVHVRQEDYATFKGGLYFYSHQQYRRLMKQVEAAFPADDVSFLVCSDASVPPEAFAGLDVVYGKGHELEDLYALAACDRLIGPPSTYSKWASFYGMVPRYEVTDPEQPAKPEVFHIAARLAPDHAMPAVLNRNSVLAVNSISTGLRRWRSVPNGRRLDHGHAAFGKCEV